MASQTHPTRAADAFDRRLLPPMMLGAALNPINSSIIAVALVPIAAAFGAPASDTAWLVSSLYLATAIGQPVVGRLVDQFGPRPLFLVGGTLVAVAGLIGLLAQSLGALIAARVVLGFGTCAGYPAAMYLIRSEGERTGQPSPSGVLTTLAITTQTIIVVGPTLGGLLIELGGWRATFVLNLPLGLASLALGAAVLPRRVPIAAGAPDETSHAGGSTGADPSDEPRERIDLVGIGLFASALIALLLFLMDLRSGMLWLLPVAVVLAAAFARVELRHPDPFIDLRVLGRNRPLLITYVRAVLAATTSYAFLYGYTQWLEDGRGFSATQAGLLLLPTFIVGIGVAALTGKRPEIRGKLLLGAVAQLVGGAAILFVHGSTPVAALLAIAVVLGIPQGLVNLAVQNALYHQAEPQHIAASAGLLRTFMYLGAMFSAAASGAFFGTRADTAGMHELAGFMVAAATVLVTITALDPSLRRVDERARGEAAA